MDAVLIIVSFQCVLKVKKYGPCYLFLILKITFAPQRILWLVHNFFHKNIIGSVLDMLLNAENRAI